MKRVVFAAALLATLAVSGCKSNSSSTAAPTVTVSPASANVEAGTQLQFGATVANATTASGTAVTWLVNSVAGVSAQQTAGFGTVDSTGLYTAPNVVPNLPEITITAELTTNNSIFNTASVNITQVPVLNVSPTTVTVAAGQTTTLTLCMFNPPKDASSNYETGVTWYVSGGGETNVIGGDSKIGFVSPSMTVSPATPPAGSPACTPSLMGQPNPQQTKYTAPQLPPSGGVVQVTAVLDADPTQTAAVTITDTFSQDSLQGTFVFNLAGTFALSQGGACTKPGYFARAGRFTADGNGGLTVIEDVNVPGNPPQNIQVNGTYTIGTDGRGTATVTDPSAFGCGTTASNYYFAFVSESEVQIAEADTFATGYGEADAQDPNSAFTGNSPTNNFAFDFSGSTVVGGVTKPTSQIGQFSVTGAAITKGQEDTNAGGALTPVPSGSLSGTFVSTDATGRGTATIQGASFAYYMISAARVRFLEIDGLGTVTGDAFQQPNNPTFSTSSLSSECSFLTSGRSPTGLAATGGVFFADGVSALSKGVVDQNNAGAVQPNLGAGGNYSVDANGRGTASLTTNAGTLTFVFYFIQAGQAILQETDSSIEADGMLVTQQGRPGGGFTTQSLIGPFAQQWTGAAAASFAEADTTGQIVLTGPTAAAAAAVTGTWDTNKALTLVPGNAVTGTYSMSGNGRGTLMITDAAGNVYNMSLYMSSLTPTGSVVFVSGTDTTRVISGQLTQQF
jgi:hypothetical protein